MVDNEEEDKTVISSEEKETETMDKEKKRPILGGVVQREYSRQKQSFEPTERSDIDRADVLDEVENYVENIKKLPKDMVYSDELNYKTDFPLTLGFATDILTKRPRPTQQSFVAIQRIEKDNVLLRFFRNVSKAEIIDEGGSIKMKFPYVPVFHVPRDMYDLGVYTDYVAGKKKFKDLPRFFKRTRFHAIMNTLEAMWNSAVGWTYSIPDLIEFQDLWDYAQSILIRDNYIITLLHEFADKIRRNIWYNKETALRPLAIKSKYGKDPGVHLRINSDSGRLKWDAITLDLEVKNRMRVDAVQPFIQYLVYWHLSNLRDLARQGPLQTVKKHQDHHFIVAFDDIPTFATVDIMQLWDQVNLKWDPEKVDGRAWLDEGLTLLLSQHVTQLSEGIRSYRWFGTFAKQAFVNDWIYYTIMAALVSILKESMDRFRGQVTFEYTGSLTIPFESQTREAFKQTMTDEAANNDTPFFWYDWKYRAVAKEKHPLVWTWARLSRNQSFDVKVRDVTNVATINTSPYAITSDFRLTSDQFEQYAGRVVTLDHNTINAFVFDYEYLDPSSMPGIVHVHRYVLIDVEHWMELLANRDKSKNEKLDPYLDPHRLLNLNQILSAPHEVNNVVELANEEIDMARTCNLRVGMKAYKDSAGQINEYPTIKFAKSAEPIVFLRNEIVRLPFIDKTDVEMLRRLKRSNPREEAQNKKKRRSTYYRK